MTVRGVRGRTEAVRSEAADGQIGGQVDTFGACVGGRRVVFVRDGGVTLARVIPRLDPDRIQGCPHPSWCSLTVQESPAGGAEELQHHVRQSRRSLSLYLSLSLSLSRSPKECTRPQRLSSPPPSTSGRCGWQSGAGPALVQPISVFASARSRGILHITSREVRSSATEARSEELLIERGRRWGLGGEKRDLSLCRAGGLSSATAPDRPGV